MTDWIITNCESVGNMHDSCQDHTEYMATNNVYVGALADGVSSNKYSDIGASVATQIACQEMCDKFKAYYSGELSSRDFVQKIQDGIRQRNAENYDLNQMKSTLLLCAICKDRYIIGHIGDGAILCFGKESYVISPPQKNEIGGTATYTVLDYNADEHFKFKKGNIKDLDGFLLTSDGLLGNVYYSSTDIPQLAYELFGSVYKKSSPIVKENRDAQFKAYLTEHIQAGNKFADDCSLLMIARRKRTGYVDYDVLNGFEADVKWPCKCGNSNRMDEIRCSKCRTVYTALYSPTIIKINSKEGFFSKLSKWINSDSQVLFDPGMTANVINDDTFGSLCRVLKLAMNNRNNNSGKNIKTTIVNSIDTTKSIERSPENQKEKIPICTTNIDFAPNDLSDSSIERMTRIGKDAISKLKKGLQSMSEMDTGYLKQQKSKIKTKKESTEINKFFPIILSYDQLNEAAYQLGHIPMAFANNRKQYTINAEQRTVVNAMFRSKLFLDLFQDKNEESVVFHYYYINNNTIAVYDDGYSDLACKISSNVKDVLFDFWLLPRHCFKSELQKCMKLNATPYKYNKTTVSWNWKNTYFLYKANASEMLRAFYNILGENCFQLDDPIANVWVVARNQELVAYLLTSRYLIRLKSLNQSTIEIDQVSLDDDSALQLWKKYLTTNIETEGY